MRLRAAWGEVAWWLRWRRIRKYRRAQEFDAFERRDYAEWERLKQENRVLGVWD
jgi:hypothetical protein